MYFYKAHTCMEYKIRHIYMNNEPDVRDIMYYVLNI